jgi:hypothetical protein
VSGSAKRLTADMNIIATTASEAAKKNKNLEFSLLVSDMNIVFSPC